MPSYRYTKDIKPEELENKPQRELSKKEKRANWWHYNWRWVAGVVVLIAIAAFFVRDLLIKTLPDYTIGFIGTQHMPEPLKEQLEKTLSAEITDINQDGKTIVQIETFVIDPEADASSVPSAVSSGITGGTTDPYTQMAGIVRLTTALGSGEPAIFICSPEDAPKFQEDFGIFGSFEGQPVPGDANLEDITIKWSESELLSSLDLNFENYNGETTNGQAELSGYLIGIRPYYQTALESKKNGKELWDRQNGLMQQINGGTKQ